MTLTAGDRLGRYEILGPLGAGGMGEVFRARDTELERVVAVKVLPESVAEDASRLERFQREAKALAALSHPNLLDIYDVGTTNGVHYAVTELLEGDTLRQRIPVSGLPWQKVAELGAGVADGLAAAHGRGIVHRDLKPENLFVTADGRVKILDFGLAKVTDEVDSEGATATLTPAGTEAGTIMGTPGYMAPEQVRGKEADSRSDIFALGCVLYEMVAGRRAFGGDSGMEVMAAILKEEPPQLSSTGAKVPVDLERTIHRCLEKRPEARFQSAADLGYSLKQIGSSQSVPVMATPTPTAVTPVREGKRPWWQLAGFAALIVLAVVASWWALTRDGGQASNEPAIDLDPNRIAVVPFVNRTGDVTLDGLAARTTDRLTQGLAELDELDVAPASAVAAAAAGGAGTGALVRDVAGATGSGLVLTGVWDSVGDGLELQATLEDAGTGTVVHAFDPIETTPDDPAAAIETLRDWTLIATQDHLHPILGWAVGDRFPSYDAYVAYRDGLSMFDSNLEHGFSYLMQSVQLDPEFARPRLMVGSSIGPDHTPQFHEMLVGFYDPVHELPLTAEQQRHVDTIDSRLQGDWERSMLLAQEEFRQNPSSDWQRRILVYTAVWANRPLLAVETAGLREWDPRLPTINRYFMARMTATALHQLGRHDEELGLMREFSGMGAFATTGEPPHHTELRALAALGWESEIEEVLARVVLEQPRRELVELLGLIDELRAHGHDDIAGRYAERAVKTVGLDTGSPPGVCRHCATSVAAIAHQRNGDDDAAYALIRQAWLGGVEPHPGSTWHSDVAWFAATAGDQETARRMLDEWPDEETHQTRYGRRAYDRAVIHALLGDRDAAIRGLRRAVSEGLWWWAELHSDIGLESLLDDPEFQAIWKPKG